MTILYRYLAWGGVILAIIVTVGIKAYIKGAADTEARITADSEKHLAAANEYGARLQASLDAQLNHSQTATAAIIMKIPYVSSHYIPSPGEPVQARPHYYLTVAERMCWNSGLSGAGPSACPDETSASPSDLALTGTDFAAAEQNAVTNFGQYTNCRIIVKGWQDWYSTISKGQKP